MARAPYILDGHELATKVKDARGQNWKSDASIDCPNCNYKIGNNHVSQDWPGLPAGVKFDPSDEEILRHLAEKIGIDNAKPHPFIEEFILTLKNESGICSTHPENLPGIKQDGSVLHVFHKPSKAYTTGRRKCRKISSDVSTGGEVRWCKTGKTKPIFENGKQKGCKKFMVLYTCAKGSKAGKTNWVMHQYHLGTEEDEREGEFVVSKVFYQQQTKQCGKSDPQVHQEDAATSISKGGPVTTNGCAPPSQSSSGNRHACLDVVKEGQTPCAVTPQDTHNYFFNAPLDYYTTYPSWSAGESEMLENQVFQGTVQAESSMPDVPEVGNLIRTQDTHNYLFSTPLDCYTTYPSWSAGESEMLENQVCQRAFQAESSMPDLPEVGNLIMCSRSEYGCIGNHEPEKEGSSENHELQKENTENGEDERVHNRNYEPEGELDNSEEPSFWNLEGFWTA